MTDYDNTNRGALFKNTNKQTEKQPDYTGTLNVAGKDWTIAAWIRDAKSGAKYMSLQVSEPREKAKPAPQRNVDEDIPF
jgi:uncharacterized protein (DUF736 family)